MHSLFNLIFAAALQGRYVCSSFADEETEARGCCVTCLRSLQEENRDLNPDRICDRKGQGPLWLRLPTLLIRLKAPRGEGKRCHSLKCALRTTWAPGLLSSGPLSPEDPAPPPCLAGLCPLARALPAPPRPQLWYSRKSTGLQVRRTWFSIVPFKNIVRPWAR